MVFESSFLASAVVTLFAGLDGWFREFFAIEFNELVLAGVIIFLSFVLTLFLTKKWIVSAKAASFVGKDMNKIERPLIPRSGGLIVAAQR